MNAGICWEQEYNRPNGLSVEKAPKSDLYLFLVLQQSTTISEDILSLSEGAEEHGGSFYSALLYSTYLTVLIRTFDTGKLLSNCV